LDPRPPSSRPRLAALALTLSCGALLAAASGDHPRTASESRVDFDRDIRPILLSRCFTCHGPDHKKRKADLRLDRREDLFRLLHEDLSVVAPGDPSRSELYLRISSADPDHRMPPETAGAALEPDQVDTLRRWIEEGAPWAEHWAFVPPARPAAPEIAHRAWPRNAIDRFVLARLESEGLSPSPEAGREALLRRATFDLTGLPPSLEEIDAFAADASPDAYERVLDRLLASPRYGERMASMWLDLARYADTNGYHIDNHRDMWKWREWVIEAFNRNVPFDRFTLEQLAGDLLEAATLEQRVASGFNRNGPINFEGGADPDEYQTKYVVDRVNTTATVWMGVTMGCAECHDHKYDPFSQREYYQLYAFFNSVDEKGLDGEKTNPKPSIKVPSAQEELRLDQLASDAQALEAELSGPMAELDAAQAAWEAEALAALPAEPVWSVLEPASVHSRNGATLQRLDDGSILAGGANPAQDVYELVAQPGAGEIAALRLELLSDPSLPQAGIGRAPNGNLVLGELEAETTSLGAPSQVQPVRFIAAFADFSQTDGDFDVANTIDGRPERGWAPGAHQRPGGREAVLVPEQPIALVADGLLRIRLRHETAYAQHAIGRFRISVTADAAYRERVAPPRAGPWHVVGPFVAATDEEALSTVWPPEVALSPEAPLSPEAELSSGAPDLAVTFEDGALAWREEPGFADGEPHELTGEHCATYLHRELVSLEEREVTLRLGSDDAIAVWLNGRKVHSSEAARPLAPDQDRVRVRLRAGENSLLVKVVNFSGKSGFSFALSAGAPGIPLSVARALRHAGERNPDQLAALRGHFRREVSPPGREMHARLEAIQGEHEKLLASIPETMVMAERSEPRPTHVLLRGDFQRKDEEVLPGVPEILPALGIAPERKPTRLDLARWLVSREHPLTARVSVNHLWRMLFGTGLVATPDDFGLRGERPSHPELLDWLAIEFQDSGWDVKAFLKLVMSSATYRQDARVTPELLERDPENRLLARSPRVRLTAEMIRDNALAVSGLLSPAIGGPSVRPYQPPGLWEAVSFSKDFSSQFYEQDHGDALYRRGLYVYWKRALPYPSLRVFDAPIRETCAVERPETVTPLQALTLLNDPTFVEAARALAERVLRDCAEDSDARLVQAFRLCTSRRPGDREMEALRRLLAAQLESWRGREADARRLISVGESAAGEGLDPVELAAWTSLANALLNLDETIHKG
jgi:hypothetical protein